MIKIKEDLLLNINSARAVITIEATYKAKKVKIICRGIEYT